MSGKFPTAQNMGNILRSVIADRMPLMARGLGTPMLPVTGIGPLHRQPGPAFMDTRYFDMTLDDGRVYRVRVSDITPEDATSRVKEST